MTDHKTSPASVTTDFDKDMYGGSLSDTDRELVAELDRVLAGESHEQVPPTLAQEESEATMSRDRIFAPQREHSPSSLSRRAALLLGLLGIVAGSAGLWQASNLGDRLIKIESAPLNVADFEQRIQRELQRIGADLEASRSNLEGQLTSRSEQLYSSIEKLEKSFTELREQLQTMQHAAAGATGQETFTGDAKEAKSAAINGFQSKTETTTAVVEPAAIENVVPSPKEAETQWVVNLVAFQNKDNADQEAERLRSDSIPVQINTITTRGTTWYRLVVSGFNGYEAAKAFAEKMRSKAAEMSWSGPWVSRD